MLDLDNKEAIKKLDSKGVYASIEELPLQIEQAWDEVMKLGVPQECSLCKNVVVSGMGGSALGGRIVDALTVTSARTPIEVSTEFRLPNYVNSETLVILSSYSGDTEETVSSGLIALKKGCKVFGITTGGKLAQFLKDENLPGYIFNPEHNSSNQPRMSLGYSISSVLAVLAKCKFIEIYEGEIKASVHLLKSKAEDLGSDSEKDSNLAKIIAKKLFRKIPVLVASGHLTGVAHAFKNQLNENAKTFSTLFDIPELNHHLLEGLKNPVEAEELLHFLFLESELYDPEVSKRYPITQEVVTKNEVNFDILKLTSDSKIKQIFELLQFGSFVSFYLAMLYEIDPAPIPWVDYFKEKLSV